MTDRQLLALLMPLFKTAHHLWQRQGKRLSPDNQFELLFDDFIDDFQGVLEILRGAPVRLPGDDEREGVEAR